jgi:hypothetical protein
MNSATLVRKQTIPPTPFVGKVSANLPFLFGLWGYWHCGHSWPIVPASGDSEDDCGEADGMYIGRETEVLGENLPQRHFCPSQNPTWPDWSLNPGHRGGK